MGRTLPLLALLALVACPKGVDPPTPAPDERIVLDDDDDADDDDTAPVTPPPYDPALEELACAATQTECADAGPHIEGTCCTYGDNLVKLARGTGAEAVGIETDGEYAYLCGGFGVRINDVSDPENPTFAGAAAPRCQRSAIGPVLDDDRRVFWLAHHGDGWVGTPFLGTYQLAPETGPDGSPAIAEIDLQEDPNTLFEGLAWHPSDTLYAAAHASGLRVYSTGPEGTPTYLRTVDGFANAWKVAWHEQRAYVIDQGVLHVLDITDPREPNRIGVVSLPGSARDLDAHGDRLFVALGGDGVGVFDLATLDPEGLPTALPVLAVDGSAQAVDANDRLLAVAAWSHVAVYDRGTLVRLGTQRTTEYPSFEQDLDIALHGDEVYVAEWNAMHALRYRPGYVSPDIWVADELVAFAAEEPASKLLRVRNRGPLPLEVGPVATTAPDTFSVAPESFTLAPGETGELTVGFTPPGLDFDSLLAISTNDADPGQAPLELPLVTRQSGRIDVGDSIGREFGFLDPTGAGDVENLRGRVVVLAYFALF